MTSKNLADKFSARFESLSRRIQPRWWWIGGAILFVSIFTLLTGTFWALITTIGLAALVVGLVAALRGSASFFHVRSKSAGRALLLAGVITLLIGSAANSLTSPQIEPVASSAHTTPDTDAFERRAAPTPTPTRSLKPTPTPTPALTESEVHESAAIPFEVTTVSDEAIDVGTNEVTSVGQAGTLTTTYLVKYVDGVEVSRTVASEAVTLAPVAEVTTIGTRQPAPAPAPVAVAPVGDCDSNYADACVPVASDVDCAGGSGNGPAYVAGPVRIVGSDIYDLDRDGDGIACD